MKIVSVMAGTCAVAAPETRCGFVALTDNHGVTGAGYGATDVQGLAREMADTLLLGEDPRRTVMLWQRLGEARNKGAAPDSRSLHAAAVLDMALWDLVARSRNEPLWKTLGSGRPKANACLVTDSAGLAESSKRVTEFGFRAAKLQAGSGAEDLLSAMAVLHESLSHNTLAPELLLSADENWTPEQAIAAVSRLETRFDLTGIEAPRRGWQAEDAGRVSEMVFAAVAVHAGQPSAQGLFRYLDHTGLDILVIDPALCGISGALQLGDAAYGYELPVILAPSPGQVAVHVAAALPTLMCMEVSHKGLPFGAGASGIRVEGGWVRADDSPGHGLDLERVAEGQGR
jgi:L-alanine-DL-glutamate epimerase-like enolase superfamily enzyme